MKTLRDYQERIVNRVCASEKNSLICLPTGSGKTVIASAIIERQTLPVVFVVPRLELIEQSIKEFGEVDVIWSDKTSLAGRHCIVASKDSLRTQYSKLPNKVVLIFDEAHVSLEHTKKLVDKIKPVRVLGLTATPERMDGKALLRGNDKLHEWGVFDEFIQQETVCSLIEKGYLTSLRYFTRPIEGVTHIKADNVGEELSDEQITSIFDKNAIWGDLVKSYEQYGRGRPALGFTNTIAMAERVSELFEEAGYSFKVIHGGMTVKERKDLIDALRTKKIEGLVNAALLTYGFDCPPVSYAFSCRHIKSRPLWFQIVGRILRLCDNKVDTIFVDHGDSISEFSEPSCSLPILDPAIHWRVNGENKEDRKVREKELKRVQETMRFLQELDPLPVDLVEITQDNSWDRLIRVLKMLKGENMQLGQIVQHLKRTADSLLAEKDSAKKVAEELREKLETAETSAVPPKYIDSKQTFEFCRKNYPYIRGMHHDSAQTNTEYLQLDAEEKVNYEHDLTEAALRTKFDKLPFIIDEYTFENSLNWWRVRWEPRKDAMRIPIRRSSEKGTDEGRNVQPQTRTIDSTLFKKSASEAFSLAVPAAELRN